MEQIKERCGAALTFLYMAYWLGFMCSTCYFNWAFAKQNGFVAWFCFGEILPTAKAFVWPISVPLTINADRERTAKAGAEAAYGRRAGAILDAAEQEHQQELVSEGEVDDELKHNRQAAVALRAQRMDEAGNVYASLASRCRTLAPPPTCRRFDGLLAQGMSFKALMYHKEAQALRQGDRAGIERDAADFDSYVADWTKQLSAAEPDGMKR